MATQFGQTIPFTAFYTSGGLRKAGLTVTVDILNPSGTKVVSAASATSIGNGYYEYVYTAPSSGAGNYRAIFTTSDTTVDAQDQPSLEPVGQNWVQNIDAATSTRSTYAGADTAGTTTLLSRIAGTLNLTSGKVDVNSLSAASVQSIWDALTSALTTTGSIGKKFRDWVLGSDNKALLSTDAQTGVVIPRVTDVTNGTDGSAVLAALQAIQAQTSIAAAIATPTPTAAATYDITQGDTLRTLEGVLVDADGTTPDLTGASGALNLWQSGVQLWSHAVTLSEDAAFVTTQNPLGWKFVYQWQAGETDVSGIYQGSVTVTFASGGGTKTYPTTSGGARYMRINIIKKNG